MEALKEHTIAFTGLREGLHTFHYRIGREFFDVLNEDELKGGDLRVTVDLDKGTHMLVTNIHIEGTVALHCDACNAPLDLPVAGDQRQIFRLHSEEETFDDEEIVGLSDSAHDINLSHYIYECMSLAMPIRRVHPEGGCDPDVVFALDRSETDNDAPVDPRWDALRSLKEDKN